MTVRHDVSAVPLQGAYVAKRCPVRAQNDALLPLAPAPPDPFTARLLDHGIAFQAEVIADLARLHPNALLIEGGDAAERQTATLAAMAAGASPILGARLPADAAGRRVGSPDVLVAGEGGGYRAIDIKWHQTLEPSRRRAAELSPLCSGLEAPAREAATAEPELTLRRREDDALQLAHYQRMLEACGWAVEGARCAGIIGVERRVVWYDLDAPLWRTPSSTARTKLRTTMERYDFEFDFRLDILAVAAQHRVDPSVDLLVVPVRCDECPTCPWNDHCRSVLEAGAGDVSLLPHIGWTPWRIHRDHGVTDRAGLAALDWTTASMVAAGVDVAGLQNLAAHRPLTAPLSELGKEGQAARQLELLEANGISAVGDLLALDANTAAYSGSGLSSLPDQIDMARAALGGRPAYRRRGVGRLVVPRGDIEVDVDMESCELGAYLWGGLLTDRTTGAASRRYTAFVTWEPLTPEREVQNSLDFWRWLMELRSSARSRGLSFRAYCYNASAENRYLRRLGRGAGLDGEVEEFVASADWIDLLRVWETQLITGQGSGLKTVAPLLGFRWDVADAGGTESMVRYDLAAAGDEDSRRWLLDYNRGDVEATLAIREWMGSAMVPGVEEAGGC
jgi:predicted RecB family nuclease